MTCTVHSNIQYQTPHSLACAEDIQVVNQQNQSSMLEMQVTTNTGAGARNICAKTVCLSKTSPTLDETYQALTQVGRASCTPVWLPVIRADPKGTLHKLGWVGDHLMEALLQSVVT